MDNDRYQFVINILKNVSFDSQLFNKEVEKAYKILLPYEAEQLTEWLENYLEEKPELKHFNILMEV